MTDEADDVLNSESYKKLVCSFVKKLPSRVLILESALSNADFELIEDESHKLINSSLFGFSDISSVAKQLEVAARQKDYLSCKNNFNRFLKIIEGLKRFEELTQQEK